MVVMLSHGKAFPIMTADVFDFCHKACPPRKESTQPKLVDKWVLLFKVLIINIFYNS